MPLPDNIGIPFGSASFKSPYLIYVDGERTLAVVDITNGRKLLTKEMTLGKYSRISDVKISGDQVVWLTSKMNRVNVDWSEHILHYCTIPELVEQKILVLQLLDIARVSFEGEFIISDSFYSTAGFRPDEQKVWKLFQNAHGPVIENRLYFSDSHFETARETARLGFVDVPTGKETILYHESIKMEP